MYINSNMSDDEIIRCTFGITNPLIRILADRLTERNRQINQWLEWSNRMEDILAERPED